MRYEFNIERPDQSPVAVIVETNAREEDSTVEITGYDEYEYDVSMVEFGEEPTDMYLLVRTLGFTNQDKFQICVRDLNLFHLTGLPGLTGIAPRRLSNLFRTILALSLPEAMRYRVASEMPTQIDDFPRTAFNEEQQLLILSSIDSNFKTMTLIKHRKISYSIFLETIKTIREEDQIEVMDGTQLERFHPSMILEFVRQIGSDKVSYIAVKRLSNVGRWGFSGASIMDIKNYSIDMVELIKEDELRLKALLTLMRSERFHGTEKPKISKRITNVIFGIDRKLLNQYRQSISASIMPKLSGSDYSRVASVVGMF